MSADQKPTVSNQLPTWLIPGSALISDAVLDKKDREDALVADKTFRNSRFCDCVLELSTFQRCNFINCDFKGCSFKEAVFEDCHFCEDETGSVWRYCELSKASFRRCNISLNKFIGCEAYGLTLEDCSAQGVKFDLNVHRKIATKTMFGGLTAEKCKLQYADFSSMDLTESRLESCDLRDANFAGCGLSHASLRGSALNNADFSEAVLDGAILAHASFDQIDFAAMGSHRRVVVSSDQHENILASMGIVTLD
ncbi:pentapeptide repeat-containing protein [Rhizobium sp. L1K21]|uniref:pentapeptide repeat-containing protein n=1 Tax=Rhizobium sp. L1K21 TaxID=2954933 RepID=UPI0020933EE2|nr:pentapeptide repeat-containing protein [Rhizobium sp. L1K21]MCO6185370.1 pentapeptide repeat-containing protein [Rhizobium sp. L1K21]